MKDKDVALVLHALLSRLEATDDPIESPSIAMWFVHTPAPAYPACHIHIINM